MQRIVLAANAEADQPWVAHAAAQLAQETGAAVCVVSVDELETERLAPMPREQFVARAQAAAARAAELLAAEGVTAAATAVRSGRALDQILEYAEEQDADLIVVGNSARSRVASALLGSVPMGLVRRSKRPVLVVTEPGR